MQNSHSSRPSYLDLQDVKTEINFRFLKSPEYADCKKQAGLFSANIESHAEAYREYAKNYLAENEFQDQKTALELSLFTYVVQQAENKKNSELISAFFHNFVHHERQFKEMPPIYTAVAKLFQMRAAS